MDIITIIVLIVGFVLLIRGADIFVDGASDLATRLKVPAIIIGLTIVAIGTSAPELAVSVTSALSNSNALAVSNVIGSNAFNLLVVLGVTAIICRVKVQEISIKQDFPILIGSSILLFLFLIISNTFNRIEGIIFLLLIVAYILLLVIKTRRSQDELEVGKPKLSPFRVVVYIVLGAIFIMIGSDMVVASAQDIALSLGMSETLVGLTIVAFGTSLPELATSITAARTNNVDIAVGNAVGSSIFNVLFILGATTAIRPIPITPVMITDTLIMIGIMLVTYLLARHNRELNRADGIIFVAIYIIYMIFVIMRN